MSRQELLFTHKPLDAQNNGIKAESYQNLIRDSGQNRKSIAIPCFFGFSDLFPLDRAAGLRGHVVDDAVDALDLGEDAVGDFGEYGEVERLDGRGHCVNGVDCTDDDGPFKATLAVLDAGGAEVRNCREILPNFAFKPRFCKFFAQNRVGFANGFETVAGDSTEATYTETGTGEGLTENHAVGKTEFFADNSDFIFVKVAKRFDEFEFEVVGKPALWCAFTPALSTMSG